VGPDSLIFAGLSSFTEEGPMCLPISKASYRLERAFITDDIFPGLFFFFIHFFSHINFSLPGFSVLEIFSLVPPPRLSFPLRTPLLGGIPGKRFTAKRVNFELFIFFFFYFFVIFFSFAKIVQMVISPTA
jgi:hypothetical protein